MSALGFFPDAGSLKASTGVADVTDNRGDGALRGDAIEYLAIGPISAPTLAVSSIIGARTCDKLIVDSLLYLLRIMVE
jgi:hypothetical protein